MTAQPLERGDQVREQAQRVPDYEAALVSLPAAMWRALDEHVVNREFDDGQRPDAEALKLRRDAVIALAVRFYIDHWPDVGPYATPTGSDRGERRGPTAFTETAARS